jgi:hypothetical protein
MSLIGRTVLYEMGRPDMPEFVPAIIRGHGKRKGTGRTYYTIEPIVDGRAGRRRNVAWYSVKWPEPDGLINGGEHGSPALR